MTRDEAIDRIPQPVLDSMVDAISELMARHSEPYRTLAECLIIDRGVGAVPDMVDAIKLAVAEDCD